MATPTRSEAETLLSYVTPGYRANAIWSGGEVVEPIEETGLVIPDLEGFDLIPWAQFTTPQLKVARLTNLSAWISTAQWSADDGSIINTDPPTWSVETTTFKQLAAKIVIDNAVDVGESDYNIVDVVLRGLAEMLVAAAYTQIFSKTPDANGPESLYDLASNASKLIDPPEGANAHLTFKGLTCLRQSLNVQRGLVEQYSLVLAPDVYGQFVQLMASTGSWTLEPDPVTGKKQWFFDRVRVIESGYVATGNALIIKSDMAALPADLRQKVSPTVGRGLLLGSPHAPGGVVSNLQALDGTDQMEAAMTVTLGLVHSTEDVAWMENIG